MAGKRGEGRATTRARSKKGRGEKKFQIAFFSKGGKKGGRTREKVGWHRLGGRKEKRGGDQKPLKSSLRGRSRQQKKRKVEQQDCDRGKRGGRGGRDGIPSSFVPVERKKGGGKGGLRKPAG